LPGIVNLSSAAEMRASQRAFAAAHLM